MQCTYDEILERMNSKFFELSGYEADRVSDIGIRIRLLAGEIFSLSSDIDTIKRQMFPNTATGQYLELHAQQRGLERRKGYKATGQLLFRLDTPLEYELTIPKGTICTTSDGSLNFVTSEEAVIIRGGNFAFINTEAEKSGTQYNVSPNEVTTIVTYFSVGISIRNASSFVGGTDDETDSELRERIMYSMRNIPNGANADYYISLAKSVENVQSASVRKRDGQSAIDVYIAGRGQLVLDSDCTEVQRVINANKALGVDVYILKAAKINVGVTVTINIESGYDFNTVKANLENNIREFFLNLCIGENVTLSALGDIVFHTDGITNYSFGSMTDTEISQTEFAVLSEITINQGE